MFRTRSNEGGRRPSERSGNSNFRRSGGGHRSGGRSYGRPKRGNFSKKIHHTKYIKRLDAAKPAEVQVITNTFDDFGLDSQLRENVLAKGFSIPTPIQDQSIKPIMEGRDIVGLASTGTGKTGAFLIPLMNNAIKDRKQKTIIVAPTRELAIQIHKEFISLVKGTKIYSAICIGGESYYRQKHDLSKRPQFVIATPGRLLDHVRLGTLRMGDFQHIVLDEVDMMLDMGFIKDIKQIVGLIQPQSQMLFFSATLSQEIERLAQSFLKNPVKVSVKAQDASEMVDQDIVKFNNEDDKFDKLLDLLSAEDMHKVLIFVATKHKAEKVMIRLNREDISTDSIHGDKRQNQRKKAIDSFTSGRVKALVATDVAARGLDIKNVSHVINFDEPNDFETYIHRIGRTGRAGKLGKSFTFVNIR